MKKQKNFTVLVITLLGLLSAGRLWGQEEQAPVNKVTPDAKMMPGSLRGSALENITAPDLFNGTVNINIPIYQFSYEDVGYGVGLSYNTQGVKVDEIESVAGLHWNLNRGASITRVMADLPDEIRIDCDSLLEKSEDSYGNPLSPPIIEPNHEMHLLGKWFTHKMNSFSASNSYFDKEFDKFVVNLNDGSFEFYLDADLHPFTIPESRYKIDVFLDGQQVINNDLTPFLGSKSRDLNFIITDNKGVKYIFRPFDIQKLNENEFEDWEKMQYSLNSTEFPDLSYISSWRIDKIILSNGQHIDYEYNSPSSTNGYSFVPGLNQFSTERAEGIVAYDNSYETLHVKRKVKESTQLSAIKYPNNVAVRFDYENNAARTDFGEYYLNQIRITQEDSCQAFKFHIHKFNGRYYLDTLSKGDCHGYQEPYYSFSYIKEGVFLKPIYAMPPLVDSGTYPPTISPALNPVITGYDTIVIKLPQRLNPAQDLYGYYNGDSTSGGTYPSIGGAIQRFIPRHPETLSGTGSYGHLREYNPLYAQAGLLRSVKNAHGLETKFVYGSHYFNSIPLLNYVPSDPLFLGKTQPSGVRVDSIIKIDKFQKEQKQITVLDYSGGQIYMPGGYFNQPASINTSTGQVEKWLFQGQFLTPHQLIHNANQGYSEVTVTNYLAGVLLGEQQYTFTNLSDSSSGNQARYYKVPGSKDYFEYPYTDKSYLKDWEIGLPLTVESRDPNNHLLSRIQNFYDFSPVDLSASSSLQNQKKVIVLYSPSPTIEGYDLPTNDPRIFIDNYYPYRGIAYLKKTVQQKYYSDTRYSTDTVWYTYDDRNNLKSTTTQTSTGEKMQVVNIYNYEVDGPENVNYSNHGSILNRMSGDGLELPVSVERWVGDGNMNIFSKKLLDAFITQYSYLNKKLRKKGLYLIQLKEPLAYADYYGISSGGTYTPPFSPILSVFEQDATPDKYTRASYVDIFDSIGNPIQSQIAEGNIKKAVIWDTLTGQKLAECSICNYADIAYSSFEGEGSETNLSFQHANVIDLGNGLTGDKVLYFSDYGVNGGPETPGQIDGTQDLTAQQSYTLSFWYQYQLNQIPLEISVGGQPIPTTNQNIVSQKDGWRNVQVRFVVNQTGKLKIKNAGVSGLILDEIRLYPSDAQMVSQTYTPLFGISSQTDPAGRITYFQYDELGRPTRVLDQDGNILSEKVYHISK